ncbi:hypothetical protein [Bradyrhizobium sp. HKCCYLS20291]
MRNHVLPAAASRRPLSQADATTRWVCLALGLSIITLAARILSLL